MEKVVDMNYMAELDYAKAEQFERTNALERAQELYEKVANSEIEPFASKAREKLRIEQENRKDEEPEEKKGFSFTFKVYDSKFEDVIGLKRQKNIIKKHVGQPLKYPDKFIKRKIKFGSGVLLYGAPRVGKTMLLKAASHEFNIPLADIKGSDIKGNFFGDSEKAWVDLFAQAKKEQPSIILIDEMDDLGAKKETINSNEGSSEAKKGLVTALVKEISDLRDENAKVWLFGATNYPWNIETALKQSGRFDFIIYVSPPTLSARMAIFKNIIEKMDKEEIGHMNYLWLGLATSGYSPADIEKIVEGAKKLDMNKQKKITTFTIQRILKDPIEGKSTLDDWYKEMRGTYLGPKRKPKKGQQEMHPGKFTREDKKQYHEMVSDVTSRERWGLIVWLSRVICRGI